MERKRGDGSVVVSVCTPDLGITRKGYTTTQPSQPLSKVVSLNGNFALAEENPAVKASFSDGKTRLEVTCIHGQPVEFVLLQN